MVDQVGVPVWGIAALGVLAAVAVFDHAVAPLMALMLRRRRQRAIDVLNQQLKLPIAPFKLAARRLLVEQLLLDPAVQAEIAMEAGATGQTVMQVTARAKRYAREIVPTFSAGLYFRVGTRLARWLSKALYRVRVGASDAAALDHIAPNSTVVFVINHRSNLDYILVTYLVSSSSALSYAVGEWARVFGLAGMIRMMGAYFIRRDSGNRLYRRVLSRYVHTATAAGVTQAIFPEGGLSRDGALQPAKMGLLSYMVSEFDPQGPRDIVFVPVGLNYDRVLEDRILTAVVDVPKSERPQFAFEFATFAKFLARNLWGGLTGRRYRYGYACVSFGRPTSLRDYLAERRLDLRTLSEQGRFGEIQGLGQRLMADVGRAVPALPVSLAALALVEADGRPLSTLELKAAIFDLMARLRDLGAEVYVPRADAEYVVDLGLRMLVLRRLVISENGLLSIAPGAAMLIAYYANSLASHTGRTVWPVPTAESATAATTAPQTEGVPTPAQVASLPDPRDSFRPDR